MIEDSRIWTAVEWVAGIFNVASTLASYRASMWFWPFGIVCISCYGALFWHLKLYGDMSLQIYFLLTCILGWRAWATHGPNHGKLPITTLTSRQRIALATTILLGSICVAAGLHYWTNSSLPWADAPLTVGSIVAALLTSYKKLDAWFLWNALNVLAVGLYFAKGIWLTGAIYMAVFVFNCFLIREWKRQMRHDQSVSSPLELNLNSVRLISE